MQELWQLVQDKDEELNKVVQMNQLMMKKTTLQVRVCLPSATLRHASPLRHTSLPHLNAPLYFVAVFG